MLFCVNEPFQKMFLVGDGLLTNSFLFCRSYVGNLDPSVTEELIVVLFGQIGTVKGCKIIHEVNIY